MGMKKSHIFLTEKKHSTPEGVPCKIAYVLSDAYLFRKFLIPPNDPVIFLSYPEVIV